MAKKRAWKAEPRAEQDRRTANAFLVTPPLLPTLCELLRERGIRLFSDGDGRVFAHPRDRVTVRIMAGLQRYKLDILAALQSAGRTAIEPSACARCGSQVVLESGDRCAICNQLSDRMRVVEPNSAEEQTVLTSVIALAVDRESAEKSSEELSPTVPTRSESPVGTVGTVGTVNQINRPMRTRIEKMVKS